MKITHITRGQLGLHAEDSVALQSAIQALQAEFTVTDIEDDADEPRHVATIHYQGNIQAAMAAIRRVLGQ